MCWFPLLFLIAGLAGCTSYSKFLVSTANYLTERQAVSCLYFTGAGGGGLGGGMSGTATGFVAFGGIDPEICQRGRHP